MADIIGEEKGLLLTSSKMLQTCQKIKIAFII